jgi:hypothetical protein
MKRLLLVGLAVASTALQSCSEASASPMPQLQQLVLSGMPPYYGKDTWTIANNLATNVAALTSISGIPLDNCKGLMGTAAATSGQTITSGNFRGYVYAPVTATYPSTVTFSWVPYAALDWAPASGNRYAVTGDKTVLSGVGRFAWVEDDIAVSGGATIDIIYAVRTAP